MSGTACARPGPTAFCRLEDPGLDVTGQRVGSDRAVPACRVAEGPVVSWSTADDAVLAGSRRLPVADAGRSDGAAVIGADDHCRRHLRRGDQYVTVTPPIVAGSLVG